MLNAIRNRFPALGRRHLGLPVAYFDGPGGTQVPKSVVDAMADYMLHHNANTHWAYPSSAETDAMLLAARTALADFLNASPTEVAFANNMTTGTFHLARALGRGWGPGDEVVVTDLDHHANVAPWRALERERGITIRRVGVDLARGQLDLASLRAALGPATRLLAIGAGSNALGTISDVAEAGRLAHAAGALVFVDAVHYAPHNLVDVMRWGNYAGMVIRLDLSGWCFGVRGGCLPVYLNGMPLLSDFVESIPLDMVHSIVVLTSTA